MNGDQYVIIDQYNAEHFRGSEEEARRRAAKMNVSAKNCSLGHGRVDGEYEEHHYSVVSAEEYENQHPTEAPPLHAVYYE